MKTIYVITSNDGDCTYVHCAAETRELADEIVQRFNKEWNTVCDERSVEMIEHFDAVEVEEYNCIEQIDEAEKVILYIVWLNAFGKVTEQYIKYLWPWDAKLYANQHPSNMILDQLDGNPNYNRIMISSFVSFEDAIQQARAVIETHREKS